MANSTATSRAIVVNQVADEFVERIKKRAESMRLGDGINPQTEMGPSVDESQFKTVLDYLNIGREDGATLVTGGQRAGEIGIDPDRGKKDADVIEPVAVNKTGQRSER